MYKRSIDGWAKHWDFILLDTICLQISFIIAYFIRYGYFFTFGSRNVYRTSSFVLLLLSVVVAILLHTMHNVLSRSLWLEVKSTILQCITVFAGMVIILYSAKDSNHVSRIVLYLAISFYAVLSILTRLLYKKILIARKRSTPKREMLLIGDELGVDRAKEAFKNHPEEGVNIKKTISIDEISTASDYIRNEWIDEVYIAIADQSLTGAVADLITNCREMAVTVHQQMYFLSEGSENIWVEKIAKQPVLTTSINIPRPRQMIVKRLVDIVSGAVLSVLAVVVLIFSAPVIMIVSPGPVLLRLERIGQNGRKFHMFVIRTMYMDAANRSPGQRIIKGIGSFLRRWSLDQLPKGFNVLAGSMSLVGTRAPSVREGESYEFHHRARLACKPGITGLYTVLGSVDDDFETATKIDTAYITNWSMALDARILLTPATLRKRYKGESSESSGYDGRQR